MKFKVPTLVVWSNDGCFIALHIGIEDRIYEYTVPINAWSLRLSDRKRLTFRDVNIAKKLNINREE